MSGTDAAAEGAGVVIADPRPGRALAAAREARNLSVAEVAQQLKLSVAQIEALETDAYDRLPGPVFVRGFVRNYARLLELDSERLVAAVDLSREAAPPSAAVPHSHNIPFPERRPVNWRVYAGGLLVLISAVVLFEFFFTAPQTVVVVPPQSKPIAAPVVAQPLPVTEATVVPQVDTAPAIVAAETIAPAPSAEPATVAPAVAKRQEAAELHFVFETRSWVEVRDRNDRVLFSQLNPAGAEQHLQGRPPLSVVIGNARGVRLTYNGQPFDLTPHTQVEVARFKLD